MLSISSHQIIVHTKLTKNILVADYGVSKNKVNVIPATIPQKTKYKPKHEPYFFYFGYMARRKGLGLALDGFAKYLMKNPSSPFKFILAGGVIGGQEQSLREILDKIKKTGLQKKIIYKGFIDEKDQDGLYRNAYAVVIPSILSMGSSGPLYHANSYGKCILASKIGHFLEDIKDMTTGYLVNNDQWAKAFEHITKHPELVKKIEMNVKKKALLRNPVATAKKYLTIYKQII